MHRYYTVTGKRNPIQAFILNKPIVINVYVSLKNIFLMSEKYVNIKFLFYNTTFIS